MSSLQLIFIILTVYYCTAVYKLRFQYPIKQLSPLLTVFSGGFYQLFAAIILFVDIINDFFDDFFKEIDERCQSQIIFIQVVSFFQLWSRGCCYTLQLMKFVRVALALKKKQLQQNSIITRLFQDEKKLLFVSLIQGILFFPIATYIQCLLESKPMIQAMQVYKEHKCLVAISIVVQEALTVIIIGIIQNQSIQDNLFKLTLYPQFLFIIWYSLTTILPINERIISFSFWLRCQIMVGLFVALPKYFVEQLPNIYITTKQINNIEIILSKKFNKFYKNNLILSSFKKYLNFKDKHLPQQFYLDNYQNEQFVIHPQINYYQKLLHILILVDSSIQHCSNNYTLVDEFYKLKQKYNIFFNYQDLSQVYLGLIRNIKQIYCNEYQNTVAFYNLYQNYKHNEIVKSNLERLNISLEEFECFEDTQLNSPFQ
ncbi:unnamed protein product (macronuclear) [Paramecium tetraurelia]|uniref:Transmembrane protein n=1 Tax=Paramecium tetraurelia TaxID=5888 RepID=A0EG69_PARTE|nr:uncharacterized protein GSPATT00026634001 [Paramecium tetraurelia]CAK94310.1 unnamed protein product [Paramecium tetraurelia]|eukprot:XP_001461683.1 hypothetical protein (macronuclear) [Paramecium tetraurelia strain d4-2]